MSNGWNKVSYTLKSDMPVKKIKYFLLTQSYEYQQIYEYIVTFKVKDLAYLVFLFCNTNETNPIYTCLYY